MRRKLLVIAAVALAGAMAVPSVALAAKTTTGNGAPSGPHFNLNIHGVSNSNGTSYSGNNKNDIFVPLTGKCAIHLVKGTPFEVVQPNCTKHGAAAFQLPTPCTTSTCTTFAYEVWVRAVTPKGHATMNTCYVTHVTGSSTYGTTFCSTRIVELSKNNKKFTTVTTTLLTVCTATTGAYEPIFKTSNKTYLWQYTNDGLRLAQFRFYPITKSTTIVESSC